MAHSSQPMTEEGYFCSQVRAVTIDSRNQERTQREIEFIRRVARVPQFASVLDVGCGTGRQSIALAQNGFEVTGWDQSKLFLDDAKAKAKAVGVTPRWVHGDVRDMSYSACFNVAVSFYTAFGYYDDEGNQKILDRVSAALLEGGAFILEMTNRDAVATRELEAKVLHTSEFTVIKENSFDVRTSRRHLDWTFLAGGRVVKRVQLDHRLYSLHELISMFGSAGLSPESVFQSVEGDPFKTGARKIILVGRKEARP